MPVAAGPDSIETGLVLSLDAADRNSYISGSTTWFDLSGNNNSGSLVNGPGFNTGSLGSIVFDGVDDFVTASSSPNFIFGTENFSISYWLYINAFSGTGIPTIVDLRINPIGGGPGYADYIQSNKFKLYWNAADRYTSTGSIVTGSWYNIAVTRQSTTVSVYFNGTLDGTATDNTNLTENGFRLARNVNTSGTSYLNGRLAAAQIYNRALSSQEVLQNYNAQKSRFGL
jgi:hypothetical protein